KATTLTMTGYHAGAVAISLLAVAYSHNWHLLFAAGGLAGLLMVPLLWWKLPESEAFRVAQEAKRNPAAASATVTEAIDPAGHVDAKAKSGMAGLFEGRLALVTIGVWASSFIGQAAGIRAQHLAAEDHGRRRLRGLGLPRHALRDEHRSRRRSRPGRQVGRSARNEE